MNGSFNTMEKLYDEMMSLPLYPAMSDKDVEDVIEAVTKIVDYYRKWV